MSVRKFVPHCDVLDRQLFCFFFLQIPGSEKILEAASGADRGNKFANLLKKTGISKAAMSSFGEPELLDDLVDHWNAGNHKEVS